MGPRSQLPVRAAKVAKKAKRHIVPACDAARYSQPAARTSRRWRSSVIRKYPPIANSSHADEKMQSIGHRQHEAHAQHQRAPPRTAAWRGGRIILIRPILARIHCHRLRPPRTTARGTVRSAPSSRRCSGSPPSKNPLRHSQSPLPNSTISAALSPATVPVAVRASQVRGSREPTTTPVARVTKANSKSGPGVMASPPVWKRLPTRHPPRQPPERFLRPSHSLRSARAAARGQGCG